MTASEDDIRFGVLLATDRHAEESDAEILDRTAVLARRAEELGLDDLWLTEHHFNPATIGPSALTLAAWLLGRTDRIGVGTAVAVLPLHSPVRLAERTALLDQLSGGRFTLGVGRGVPGPELGVLGVPPDAWRAGLAEPLDTLLGALRGEPLAGPGDGDGPALRITPAPATRPAPPVCVAAGSPASIGTAARRGLPLMLFFDKNARAKAEMLAAYRAAGGPQHPRGGHAFAVFAQVTETEAEAARLMADRARFTFALNNRPGRPAEGAAPPPGTPEDVAALAARLLETQPVGPVATCVARLTEHLALSGARRVMCQVEAAPGTDAALRNLERLATEVLPAVRRRLAGAAPVPAGQAGPAHAPAGSVG